ncbi:MAG: CRISPR-associated protein Cas4 [Candidatus Bathyarchaeia archaeon]
MSLSVTNVVEHAFCPRFTYFQLVLGIKQREEKRGTVIAGRELHSRHSTTNRNYIIAGVKGRKFVEAYLYSEKLQLSGKIDEAIETDAEIIIIERKYSDYTFIGKTLKTQLALLALLAEETFAKKVKRAIVIFQKKRRAKVRVNITEKTKNFALKMLQSTRFVIETGVIPRSQRDNRCINCCYRKLCPPI